MEAQTIFFVGKPASGKGTQAELLSKKTGWPIIGTSQGMLEIIAEGGPVGKKLKETRDAGYLTPYWMPGYVFLKSLTALPADQSVIFDGFHRSVGETQIIVESLRWISRPFSIIHLKTTDDEIKNRITLRREKEGRLDDHDDATARRIDHYYELTDKAIAYMREQGILIELSGEGPIDKIHEDILEKLGIK